MGLSNVFKGIFHSFKIFIIQIRYDVDKSGAIDKKEMTKVMKSIYAMLSDSNNARDSSDEAAAAHAAKLFREVDVNNDGELSLQEFIDGCRQDAELMLKLKQLVDQCMEK